MRCLLTLLFATLLLTALTAPRAQAEEVGSGDLYVSEGVLKAFAKFQEKPRGLYFAVSTNGWAAGYSVCTTQRCKPSAGKKDALAACRKSQGEAKGTCFIFGDTDRILWRGKVVPTVRNAAADWG